MSNTKEIKHKIRSIQSTKKIAHAMEMLATSKMKKSQSVMRASRPFSAGIIELIANVAYSCSNEHPFFIKRPEVNVGILVIGTDRGLCANLNTSLFRQCWHTIQTWHQENPEGIIKIATIGEKAKIFFGTKCGYSLLASQEKIGESPSMQHLIGVIKVLSQEYKEQKLDKLYIAYNEFITTMKQKPIIKQLLPIINEDFLKNKKLPTEYLFEPNATLLLDLLLNRYLESIVYQGVVENIASEQSSRMIAMKNATENAEQIISDLHLHYNKERQAIITKEVAEIVSGATSV